MSLDEFIKYNKLCYGVEPKISPLNYDIRNESFIISQFDNLKNVFIYVLDDVTNKKIVFSNEDVGDIVTFGLTKCFNLYEICEKIIYDYADVYLYPLRFIISTRKEIVEVNTELYAGKDIFLNLNKRDISLLDSNDVLQYTGELSHSTVTFDKDMSIITGINLDSYECIPRCLKLEYDPSVQIW